MKPTIIRNLDFLNRINIPKELMDELGWHHGDDVEIYHENDEIIMRVAVKGPDTGITILPA